MLPLDPFSFKTLPKSNIKRALFTLRARLSELQSRVLFHHYQLPMQGGGDTNLVELNPAYDQTGTAVTPKQMNALCQCLQHTESLSTPIVEVGSYRGVTARTLATNTSRPYFAVDPFIGYGGSESDLAIFRENTSKISNIQHLRMTSGQAMRSQLIKKASLIFVDAVHDYVNARFDGHVWGNLLENGGLIAFHDTDNPHFPGVRRSVYEMLTSHNQHYELFLHTHDLVVLRRR
jgi:hypothetical protein